MYKGVEQNLFIYESLMPNKAITWEQQFLPCNNRGTN